MFMQKFKIDSQLKDLLIGTLLGDGNLKTETKGQTWSYRALHKKDHKEYLDHKYSLLKSFCKTSPKLSIIYDIRTNKNYERYYFNTLTNNSFRFYGNLFYTFDPVKCCMIKDVPVNIEKFLTPRAIAYWYMDDGSIKWLGKSNAMRICTESFSLCGVKRLKNALKSKYNIDTSLIRKTNNGILIGYRLAINEENSSNFRELIKPYLITCMCYKVSDGLKGHL